MRLPLALLLPFIPLVFAVQKPVNLQVHHRYLPTSGPSEPKWIPLGIIPVDEDLTASNLDNSRVTGGDVAAAESGDFGEMGEGWYQVGVEQDGLWVIGSTRACLLSPSPPSLTLHLQSTHLTSLSITPPLSRYQNTTMASTSPPSLQSLKDGSRSWEIQISRARRIDSPSLPAPPSLTSADPSTGLPKPAEPEKTLLQKYWLPLLGISLFLLGQLGSGAAQATQGEGGVGAQGEK